MATASETTPSLLTSIEQAIQRKDYEQVEQCWLQLAQTRSQDIDLFLDYSDEISKVGAPSRASLLLQMLVPDLMSQNAHVEAFRILRHAAEHTPADRDVRGLVLECVRELYKDNPFLARGLEVSGLDDSADLRKAIQVFETYLSVSTGAYVFHEAGWGVGKIVEFDPEKSEVYIDFRTRKRHRMAFSAIGKMVKRLEPDHYRVLTEFDPDRLRNLAKSDAAEFIKKVVRDEGRPLNVRQMKALVSESIVSPSAWSKFWSDAKAKLRRDPSVALGSGNNPTIELRREALSYEEAMLRKYRAARSRDEKTRLARECLQHRNEEESPRFFAPVIEEILPLIGSEQLDIPDRITLLLLCREVQKALPKAMDGRTLPSAVDLLRQVSDPVGLIERIPIGDYRRELVPLLQESLADAWPDFYEKLLLSRCSDLWDLAYRGLVSRQHGERIRRAFAEVSRLRDEKPENFAWFCRSGVIGRISSEILEHSRVDLFENLLILLDKLGSERGSVDVGKDARALASLVRQILFHEIGDLMNKIFEEAGQERTRHMLTLILHNRGLTEYQRISLESRAYVVFPKLDVEEKKPHEEEQVIYVTEPGLRKQQDELQRLIQVELPGVAQEIGRAKAFGDLSENAEYSAALEKQAQLAQRAQDMQKEIQSAKLIEPSMVRDDEVSIGTRVTLRNTQRGFLETYTILGPWDADFDQHVISYRAAVARGLLGRRKGETVAISLPEGSVSYEIMAIVKAIA
ncbi:MAG: transcription elongation factor GreA [Planctomycetes bacterium]|nr:transcription elongation factor GreA [Planctomycetota bacterium]